MEEGLALGNSTTSLLFATSHLELTPLGQYIADVD